MSRSVQLPPMLLPVLVALSNVAHATPPVSQAREPIETESFQCSGSMAKTLYQCFGRDNGWCGSGSRCFMRETYKTQKLIASCCCNTTTTPIEKVLHNWSCWVDFKDGEAAHGGRPFCDILCCKRPALSRACYGNGPICCDESKQCGVNTSRGKCCAPRPGAAPDPHCSATRGRTCGWVQTSWITVLMPREECLVGSQANCSERCELLPRGLWVTALCAFAAACTSFKWLEHEVAFGESERGREREAECLRLNERGRGEGALTLERERERKRRALTALTQVLVLFIMAFLMLFTARWAGHAWGMCLLWAATWLVLAALPGLLWHRKGLLELVYPQELREQSLQSSGVLSLAILVNLEDYEFWRPVEDNRMEELKDLLIEKGWTVPPIWRNLRREDFDSLICYVRGIIKNSSKARVLIYVSCHSQMVFGDLRILPVEAGKCWWRSVSVYDFLYQLGRIQAEQPYFVIIVNGCLDSPTSCWQRLASRTLDPTVRLYKDPLPTVNDAEFSGLFANAPNRQASGTLLTGHLIDFFGDSASDAHLQKLFDYVHQELGVQRPFLWTTARPANFGLTPSSSPRSSTVLPADDNLTPNRSPCSSTESLQRPLCT